MRALFVQLQEQPRTERGCVERDVVPDVPRADDAGALWLAFLILLLQRGYCFRGWLEAADVFPKLLQAGFFSLVLFPTLEINAMDAIA